MKNIAFFGKFNSGKSTLINSLLGYKVVPEKPIPTHVPCVKIEYGDNFEIKGFNNKSQQIYSTKLWNEFERTMENTAFSYVKVTNPHPFLKYGYSIWDTPGIDDIHENYTNYADSFLQKYHKEISAAYFLVSNTAITNTELDFLKKVYSKVNDVVVLLSKADKYNGTDSLKVISDFEKTIKSHTGVVPIVRAVSPKMIWEDSISGYFKDKIEFEVYEEKVSNVVRKFDSVNTKLEKLISEYVSYQGILNDAKKALERTVTDNRSIIKSIFDDNLAVNQTAIRGFLKESLDNNKKTLEKVLENNLESLETNITSRISDDTVSIVKQINKLQKHLEEKIISELNTTSENIKDDLSFIQKQIKTESTGLKGKMESNNGEVIRAINISSESASKNIQNVESISNTIKSNLSRTETTLNKMGTQEATYFNTLKYNIDQFRDKTENTFFNLLNYSSKEFLFIKLSLSLIIILNLIFLTKYFNLW